MIRMYAGIREIVVENVEPQVNREKSMDDSEEDVAEHRE